MKQAVSVPKYFAKNRRKLTACFFFSTMSQIMCIFGLFNEAIMAYNRLIEFGGKNATGLSLVMAIP